MPGAASCGHVKSGRMFVWLWCPPLQWTFFGNRGHALHRAAAPWPCMQLAQNTRSAGLKQAPHVMRAEGKQGGSK